MKKMEERKPGKEFREKQIVNGNTEEITKLKYHGLCRGRPTRGHCSPIRNII
jgi:hypothetical protein